MKDTAPGYNLSVSADVDDRYDVMKSTDAACKYLKQAYAKFGNWTAAAASYNCGMGGYNNFATQQDRKSTRLNSSHANISYAVFCLKKTNFYTTFRPLSRSNATTSTPVLCLHNRYI